MRFMQFTWLIDCVTTCLFTLESSCIVAADNAESPDDTLRSRLTASVVIRFGGQNCKLDPCAVAKWERCGEKVLCMGCLLVHSRR